MEIDSNLKKLRQLNYSCFSVQNRSSNPDLLSFQNALFISYFWCSGGGGGHFTCEQKYFITGYLSPHIQRALVKYLVK